MGAKGRGFVGGEERKLVYIYFQISLSNIIIQNILKMIFNYESP